MANIEKIERPDGTFEVRIRPEPAILDVLAFFAEKHPGLTLEQLVSRLRAAGCKVIIEDSAVEKAKSFGKLGGAEAGVYLPVKPDNTHTETA